MKNNWGVSVKLDPSNHVVAYTGSAFLNLSPFSSTYSKTLTTN